MALPATESFTGTAAVLPNPPFTQAALFAEGITVNRNGSGGGIPSATGANADGICYDNANVYGSDHESSELIVSGLNGDTFSYAQVIIAAQGTGATFDCYEAFTDGGSGVTHTGIGKYVNQTFTGLKDCAVTYANGDRIGIRKVGGTIYLLKNGAIADSVNDSAVTGGTAGPGTSKYGSGGNVVIDDWIGDNVSVGALPDTAAKAPFPRARLLLPNRPFGSCNPLREMKWNDFGAGAGGPVNTPISLDVLSTFTPAATFQSAYNRTLAVATAWTSTVARVAARSLALAVNSTFTPALQRNFSRALSVASTFVTNLVVGRAYARTVSVTSAFVAALTESAGYQRALSVTSSFVAALTRQAGHVKTLAVSGTWSVAIQRGISHTLAISSSFAVSLTRKASYQRTLAITSTYTPSLNRTAAHFCALAVASVFVVGLTVGRGFFRTLAVGSTLGVSITKLTTHTYLQALAATSTFTVSLTRTLAWRRALAVASVYAPALVRIATHPRTLAVASPFVAVLMRGIALRMAVGSVFVTALKRGISLLLSVTPSFVAHILQGLAEILIGFLTHIQAAFQVRAIDAQPNETSGRPNAAFEVRRSS